MTERLDDQSQFDSNINASEQLNGRVGWNDVIENYTLEKGIPANDPRVESLRTRMQELEDSAKIKDFLSVLCIHECKEVFR